MYTEKERIYGNENRIKVAAIQISYEMGKKEETLKKIDEKISEAADIEHYAAYAPITSPVPSFHMPEYFAEAVLV